MVETDTRVCSRRRARGSSSRGHRQRAATCHHSHSAMKEVACGSAAASALGLTMHSQDTVVL